MADTARGSHTAPGVYTREFEVAANVKSLGITTLGVVGETLQGPAFEPIKVSDWASFKKVFGGTDVTTYKGSKFPKYELPYIAKSYFEQSQQLDVVRVLGLSGYNAGPAWLITAGNGATGNKPIVIAVIRSRGHYEKYHKYVPTIANDCKCAGSVYDKIRYDIGEWDDDAYDCTAPSSYNMDALGISNFVSLEDSGNECDGYTINGVPVQMYVSANNYGLFCLEGTTSEGHYLKVNEVFSTCTGDTYVTSGDAKNPQKIIVYPDANGLYFTSKSAITTADTGYIAVKYGDNTIYVKPVSREMSEGYFKYSLSLNPADKNYILKVIGGNMDAANAPIYCESLYDVALQNGINDGSITFISNKLTAYDVFNTFDYCGMKSVSDFVPISEEALTKKYVGKRYLADEGANVNVHLYNYVNNRPYVLSDNSSSAITKYTLIADKDAKENITSYTFTVTSYTGYDSAVTESAPYSATQETFKFTAGSDGIFTATTKGQRVFLGETGDTGITLYIDPKTYSVCVRSADFIGQVLVVKQFTYNGVRHYVYSFYSKGSVWLENLNTTAAKVSIDNNVVPILDQLRYTSAGTSVQESNYNINKMAIVKNEADGYYYRLLDENGVKSIVPVTVDLNDYKSSYRFASTPWIVSNAKGDRTHIELHKLFRFHTISDGDNANNMFKVSITDIKPDDLTFTVVLRDINDTDANPVVLEKYSKCNLEPGSANYIAYKIGSYDGTYESKSNYVTVEVNETTTTKLSVPAGFIGYPINFYNGYPTVGNAVDAVSSPTIPYNSDVYTELKAKKQYFGLSDLAGIDVDTFTFKGDRYYIEGDNRILGNGFHLDCRVNEDSYSDNSEYSGVSITVEGESGYTFTTVNSQARTEDKDDAPIIATEEDMSNTIYSDVNMRKFTVMFYGGFDGWDVYRADRTNTDDFTYANYKGRVNSVNNEGSNFKGISDAESLGLTGNSITSDYYAYLAAIRKFSNPNDIYINLLATPGIDIENQNLLVKSVIEMVEEERQDTLYLPTLPDKPYGADDSKDEMYSADDVSDVVDDSTIDTKYAAVYYPWAKYLDSTNNMYIYLPVTRDIVRNMAKIDNFSFPWYSPAGFQNGNVDCIKVKKSLNIGERDALANNRINPIINFTTDGCKVFGQKTLYDADDDRMPLTRIAIRRLMLYVRKSVVDALNPLVFDQYDQTEVDKVYGLLNNIMSVIKENRGIVQYKIEISSSDEDKDRREMPIKIWIKPTTQIEYFSIDFMITQQGVSFEDL